ncbi:MAG: hypothetical protein HY817_00355 [Candidatus Abawacabacteria bacterium]|nr:hypothetical protein [Candidatus Abawacabacteria bacterium]
MSGVSAEQQLITGKGETFNHSEINRVLDLCPPPYVLFVDGALVHQEDTTRKVAELQSVTRSSVIGITGPLVTSKGLRSWARVLMDLDYLDRDPVPYDLDQIQSAERYLAVLCETISRRDFHFVLSGYSQGAALALRVQVCNPHMVRRAVAICGVQIRAYPYLPSLEPRGTITVMIHADRDRYGSLADKKRLTSIFRAKEHILRDHVHSWSCRIVKKFGEVLANDFIPDFE